MGFETPLIPLIPILFFTFILQFRFSMTHSASHLRAPPFATYCFTIPGLTDSWFRALDFSRLCFLLFFASMCMMVDPHRLWVQALCVSHLAFFFCSGILLRPILVAPCLHIGFVHMWIRRSP